MNGTQAKIVKKIIINEEKEKVIERYENVLNVLKEVEINEDNLVHIKEHLDELESYLKYIPNGPLFNDVLPTEIKERILKLSFPRDTGAFIAASVCQQWRKVLKIEDQKKIVYCENGERVNPADLMKAVSVLKLDVHLVIGKSATEVDPKLVTDALTSVSQFTITDHLNYKYGEEILSGGQLEHLFANIEKGDKLMEEVELIYVDLMGINQEMLSNCLVNKIKRLTLKAFPDGDRMLDVGTFISKLLQVSSNLTLSHLTLTNIDLFDLLHDDKKTVINIANALCNVKNVKLCGEFVCTRQITETIMKNILKKPIVMETLIVDPDNMANFRDTINPQDLNTVFIKMKTLKLLGAFTVEQRDAIRSLPEVEIDYVGGTHFGIAFYAIKKGSSEML